ncbi:hypothetical protein TsocGM_24910 [Tautonia sociabilis]|uniref:Neutral/alkaline non-lysosomal ceramidase N-terminal domain-containing protein n=2 Tax=Tautonia sociabilis TaxID=2080755 RepID=A0A432MC55_9BACT|nr:hypothetical protein TsocGM_24910 [Tautonia sociabilis]
MILALAGLAPSGRADEPLRVGTFDIDASPPVGTPMAYDPTAGVQDPLHCKGVVLIGEGGPVVLVAVDWIGIANDGQTAFKEAIASAVGTTADRVAVHALHQHDAPTCDFTVAELLVAHGIDPSDSYFDPDFAREVIARAAEAAREAKQRARAVSHVGLGEGMVEEVASNRRILGPDGKVRVTRYTACRDPEVRAEPAGTIDPMVKLLAFFDGDEPVAALSYYATHPQSYYRTGLASCDFPGLAREAREDATGVPHVHFDGAGGNIGAGKWNDGSPENRQILADRVAEGMRLAWEAASGRREPISAGDLGWEAVPVVLPPGKHLVEESLEATLADPSADNRIAAARGLAWLRRCLAGDPIPVSCLAIGPARILHLPGELFVEYQLAAQAIRPDLFVCMAAYGDYAPGYIGTASAYYQVGYEASDRASRVAPTVEIVLLDAISQLLGEGQ